MAKHLEGKVAVVTGAGRGIGKAVALALANQGAAVVVADIGTSVEGEGTDASLAQQVVDEIKAAGGRAVANTGDVADHQQAEALIRQALDEFGGLDILVNVAGILRERMIFNLTEDDWDAVIRVHLKGTYNTTHFASIHWRTERKGGYRLINFSSTAGIVGNPAQSNYAAAKGGIIAFTKSCANALYRYGVIANSIAPFASTRMNDRSLVNVDATRAGKPPSETAAGTERDTAHIGTAVAFLCTEAAGNVSGRCFGIQGHQLTLYSDMVPERELFGDQAWTVDSLVERAPKSLLAGITLKDVEARSTPRRA